MNRQAPVQALADRLENLGERLRQTRRAGEDGGGRVLSREATFAGLAYQVHAVQRLAGRHNEGGQ